MTSRKRKRRHSRKKKHSRKKHSRKKHSRKKEKKWKNENCAISADKASHNTCYSSQSLYKLRDMWNTRHPDNKIETNNIREIWNQLKYFMRNTCSTESCWLRQNFSKNNLNNELNNYTFAPKSPDSWKKKPNEWLNSLDFLKIMKQYERKYKCFQFLGPSPIDYDKHLSHGECVWEELCKFNLEKMIKKGKTKIGVIFNIDPHNKEGSHWVAVFVNIRKREVYYFDSYGERTSKFINRFVNNKIIAQGETLGMDFKYIKNKKRHQYRSSECGMYCLYFIIQMLTTDISFEKFIEHKIEDKKVFNLRKQYFNQ